MKNEKRLIDANALNRALIEEYHGMLSDETLKIYQAIRILDECPTVDAAEVKHGYWVGTRYDGYADGCPVYDLWECSECREEYESEGDPPPYNYCPNCGAKMDGDGNGT